MREDYAQRLEAMFPEGCVVFYPVDDQQRQGLAHVRAYVFNPQHWILWERVKQRCQEFFNGVQADLDSEL